MGLKRAIPLFFILFLLLIAFHAIAQSEDEPWDDYPWDGQGPGHRPGQESDQGPGQGLGQGSNQEPGQGTDQGSNQGPDQGSNQGPDQGPNQGFDQEPDQGSDSWSDEMPIDSEWTGPVPDLYSMGDRTFSLSAGLIIPTLFLNDRMEPYTHNLNLGGTGSISFCYFLNAHFFVGGEIGGMFAQSLMENFIYIIPLGGRVGYQFIYRRFEFPISLMIGISPTRYLDKDYLGFFMKPQASIFFRFNPDWSFGFNTAWWWVPQWTEIPENSRIGNFLELTLSARYHF